MTPEEIKAMVAEAAKVAAAEAAKTTAAEISATYDAKLEAQRVDFDKRLAAATAKPPEVKPVSKAGEVSPEIAALQESNARLAKQFEEERAKNAAISRAARDKETAAAISTHLQSAGIKPEMIRATSLLIREQIGEREDGTVIFRGKHPTTGLPGEFDIADGIKAWASSDEGKHFIAPRNVQGTGNPSGRPAGNQSSDESLDSLLGFG